jgi:hypothetical protein
MKDSDGHDFSLEEVAGLDKAFLEGLQSTGTMTLTEENKQNEKIKQAIKEKRQTQYISPKAKP